MTTLARRIARGRSWWYTTAFWVILLVCLYSALRMADWWWLIIVAVIGTTANYCWWSTDRRRRFRFAFAAVFAGFTLVALAAAGWLVLHTASVPVDSVGDKRVVCGTMLNPLPADQLRMTSTRTGEPVLEAGQVSVDRLKNSCDSRFRYRSGDLPGVLVTAILLGSRTAGHLIARDPTDAKAAQHITDSR